MTACDRPRAKALPGAPLAALRRRGLSGANQEVAQLRHLDHHEADRLASVLRRVAATSA